MDILIYDNMGVLGREKQHVYTTAPMDCPWSEGFYIIIPDLMNPYETKSGEIALTVPGERPRQYLLQELLATGRDGMPVLAWIDDDGERQVYHPGTFSA